MWNWIDRAKAAWRARRADQAPTVGELVAFGRATSAKRCACRACEVRELVLFALEQTRHAPTYAQGRKGESTAALEVGGVFTAAIARLMFEHRMPHPLGPGGYAVKADTFFPALAGALGDALRQYNLDATTVAVPMRAPAGPASEAKVH